MAGPFDPDWEQRRAWWDQRLWLQMILVGAIIVVAITVVYGPSLRSVAVAAASTSLVYVITRRLMHK